MFDFSLIKRDTIIIAPIEVKAQLIKEKERINPSFSIKIISKEDVLNGVYFEKSIEAIWYLHNKKGYSLANAEEIVSSLYGIKGGNEKLDLLKGIYDELFSSYLLEFNPYFKLLFKNKDVFVYRYSSLDKELINSLAKINVKPIYFQEKNNEYNHKVFTFNTMDDELDFVFARIGSLLSEGVPISKIKMFTLPSEYVLPLKKYSYKHHIPFEKQDKLSLYSSPVCKLFISLLKDYEKEEAFTKIGEIYQDDPYKAKDRIVSIINEINELNLSKEEFESLFIYKAKKTYLKNIEFENAITYVTSLHDIKDDEHVFMMGFSLGQYPPIHKDTDFFLDAEKRMLNLNTSSELNKMEEEKLISFLQRSKNLTITFKEKIGKSVYFKPLLIKKLHMEEEKGEIDNIRYSYFAYEEEEARNQDLFDNYRIVAPYKDSLSRKDIKYKSYDHKFKKAPIMKNDEHIKLSYSSIEDYNNCPFKYYIGRVLKANIFEEKFSINLGNYYHLLLENSVSHKYSSSYLQEEFDRVFISAKDRFFASFLLEQFKDVERKNNDFLNVSKYKDVIEEKEVAISLDNNTSLYGKVDKTLIDEEDKEIIVVDYKTYNFEFEIRKVQFGLNMQLPLYSILLEEKYKDYKVTGVYIQNILINPTVEVKKPYYLNGLTINDLEIASHIDLGYASSSYIKGLATNKSGYLNDKKQIITSENFKELIEETRKQIFLTLQGIREGNFNIAPKLIDEYSSPCSSCEARDICYKDYKDNVYIKLKKEKEEN
ncbi:MAG: PD-(D/E)XK nuclease family protein [Bacilli bacterium]